MTPLHEQLRERASRMREHELADDLSQDPRRLLIEAADRLELVEGLYEARIMVSVRNGPSWPWPPMPKK